MHEENGVKFYLEAGVKEIVGEGDKAVGVALPSGQTLEADMVVAGVGVVPETSFLKDSQLPVTKRGELEVNEARCQWSLLHVMYMYVMLSSSWRRVLMCMELGT